MDFEIQIAAKLKMLRMVQRAGLVDQEKQLNREIIELYILRAVLLKHTI